MSYAYTYRTRAIITRSWFETNLKSSSVLKISVPIPKNYIFIGRFFVKMQNCAALLKHIERNLIQWLRCHQMYNHDLRVCFHDKLPLVQTGWGTVCWNGVSADICKETKCMQHRTEVRKVILFIFRGFFLNHLKISCQYVSHRAHIPGRKIWINFEAYVPKIFI